MSPRSARHNRCHGTKCASRPGSGLEDPAGKDAREFGLSGNRRASRDGSASAARHGGGRLPWTWWGMNLTMIVVGRLGEQIGTVEQFEIDRQGHLKSLVVRIASSLGTRKRITAEQIRAIRGGTVEVAV